SKRSTLLLSHRASVGERPRTRSGELDVEAPGPQRTLPPPPAPFIRVALAALGVPKTKEILAFGERNAARGARGIRISLVFDTLRVSRHRDFGGRRGGWWGGAHDSGCLGRSRSARGRRSGHPVAVADPAVARGVAGHSDFATRPLDRLHA